MVAIALYQPDQPGNFGALLRLCACFAADLHVIEPCGFPLNDARIRRAGMDYAGQVAVTRHAGWEAFRSATQGRLLLFTTRGDIPYHDFDYRPDDILLFGSESAGVPKPVHDAADARLVIPLAPGIRSLNLAMSAAIALGHATLVTKP